ncbi:UBP7, partial [Symbiodinium sp. KB8]
MELKVKWNKQRLSVEVDPSKPVSEFKAELLRVTGVPVDRQKIISKAWRGMLKDDTDLSTPGLPVRALFCAQPMRNAETRASDEVTLMGSAEGVAALDEAESKVVFMEDMKQEERTAAGVVAPSGFVNLGNTCYMNATTQALRAVPELRGGLATVSDSRTLMAPQLAQMYKEADGTSKNYMPSKFLAALHRMHPTFAERGKTGQLMQHDTDEFLTTMLETLSHELTKVPVKDGKPMLPKLLPRVSHDPAQAAGASTNLVDTLFGVEFKVTDTNTADPSEVTTAFESNRKLVCNIDGGAGSYKAVNHLTEGVSLALNGQREKMSTKLGTTTIWDTKRRISRLPKYLCVQFMRFYFKATPDSADHAGVKCKMMRKVAFSEKLDVFDYCTPEAKKLEQAGEVAAAAASGDGGAAATAPDAEGDVTLAPPAPALGEEVSEIDAELAQALALSAQDADAVEAEDAAVMGRSADSGHYMGWVRTEGDAWFVFDDEEVQQCELEHVLQLHGGGDRDMAYLVFYRAK